MTTGSLQTNAAVTVTTAATALLADSNVRVEAEIFNNSTLTVFIGDGAVTAANGRPLHPGRSLRVRSVGSVYGITAAGSANVRVFEVN